MKSLRERAMTARRQVVADHTVLRQLTTTLLGAARRALAEHSSSAPIRAALRELRMELEIHLEYEEKIVAPLFLAVSAASAQRVDEMVQEHTGQRAVLVALTDDVAEGGRDLPAILDELLWFARSFERDMEEEERLLFHDDLLGIGDAPVAPPAR